MDAPPARLPRTHPPASRVLVVNGFLDALADEEYDDALTYISPGVDWTYCDLSTGSQFSTHGAFALRSFLKRNRTARESTIVCVSTHQRFVFVSEQMRDRDGRVLERHGAYVVEDDLVTQAWVSDL